MAPHHCQCCHQIIYTPVTLNEVILFSHCGMCPSTVRHCSSHTPPSTTMLVSPLAPVSTTSSRPINTPTIANSSLFNLHFECCIEWLLDWKCCLQGLAFAVEVKVVLVVVTITTMLRKRRSSCGETGAVLFPPYLSLSFWSLLLL